MRIIIFLWFAFFSLQTQSAQNRIDYLNFTSQNQFEDFAVDLTGALDMKTLRPAEPLGLIGFDLGIATNLSKLVSKKMDSVSNNGRDDIESYSFHAVKGLPLGLDIGIDYTTVPGSNISTWGGQLSWAITDGTTILPAIGIQGHFTQTTGLKALSYQSYGLEVGVSKGFFNFTPYASLGMVQSEVKPLEDNQTAGVTLKTVTSNLPKAAVGVNINFLVMDVLIAANQIGEVPTYSLKLGYRF